MFIMVRSGAVFAFDTTNVQFVYQDDGYFTASGMCSLGGHNAFRKAIDITFHHTDVCCHWIEETAL